MLLPGVEQRSCQGEKTFSSVARSKLAGKLELRVMMNLKFAVAAGSTDTWQESPHADATADLCMTATLSNKIDQFHIVPLRIS